MEIAKTPETSLTGLVRYERPAPGLGTVALQGSASYRSDFFFTTENDPIAAQEGYTLVNARIEFAHQSGRWNAAVFSNNLFDQEYQTLVNDLSDFGVYTRLFGRPRVVGFEFGLTY